MNLEINNIIVILTTAIVLFIFFSRKIRTASLWHATVTPLASIIGSGFLVSAPLLLLATGRWAFLVMCIIVVLAYAIGTSLRFNIQHIEPRLNNPSENHWINRIETLSRPILGIAYIISVAFYLKLLSAFALRGIGYSSPIFENILTTFLLLFIGIIGKFRGLSMLELLETYSVNVKLAIIAAIIVAHFIFNAELFIKGQWLIKACPHESWWMGFKKVLGMLIIIQGFETSRYLGHAYSVKTRIQTMRYAQWISGGIYITYIALTMIVFNDVHNISETTVIDLCRIVAPILPILLVIAAIMSQFSAAVADTVGSGGLLEEATYEKISAKSSYLLISLVGISLTWLTNIYEIITIASKAFAIYYALQLSLSMLATKKTKQIKWRRTAYLFYAALLGLMILVITLGIPVE